MFLKTLDPNLKMWAFWVKKYQPSNLNKTLHAPYFEGADFKLVFENFEPNSKIWAFWVKEY